MRCVSPEVLQVIEITIFLLEDVNNYIAVVQNNPEIILHSLHAGRLQPELLANFLDNVVGNCRYIGGRTTLADDKEICYGCSYWTEIDGNYVFPFLVEDGVCNDTKVVCNHRFIKSIIFVYKYNKKRAMGEVIWYDVLDSTNNEAKRLISKLDNLSVIAAIGQSAGRGQGDHSWYSTPGKNITATVVLKPNCLDAGDYLFVTRVTTLALLSYLASKGVQARIKWPNDIWVDERKICGILIENITVRGKIEACLIGIGLNINEEGWPENLPNPVSLKELTGKDYDVKTELGLLLEQISRHCEMLLSNDGRKSLEQEFSKHVFRLPEGL